MGAAVAGVGILAWMSGATPSSHGIAGAPRPSLSEADRADLIEFLEAQAQAPLSEESLVDIVTEPFGARYVPSASRTKPKIGTCTCQHRDTNRSSGRSCQELRESGVCDGPYPGKGLDRAECQDNVRENAPKLCKNCLGHCHFKPAK
ncbi:hypothetical protein ACLEPN_37965 [Myxococcus sp. 1LA]